MYVTDGIATIFKEKHPKWTSVIKSPKRYLIEEESKFGETYEIEIKKYDHLLHKTYLEIELPELTFKDKGCWKNYPGLALLKRISFRFLMKCENRTNFIK